MEATDRSSSQGSATLGECPHFGQAALDSLSTPIAVLDASGTILAVNTAWRRFADANDLRWPNYCLGANYLDVCDAVTGNDAEHAQQAARGIQEVMSRQRSVFSYEYPYHSADEQQWLRISSTRFSEDDSLYVVVPHENITPRKEAAQVLRQVHDTLEQGVAKRTAALQQLNAQLYEDIAARRHVEEALRASEEQFRSLIAGAIEGVIILRDFVPLFANQAYAEMFGYTSPEDILRMDTVFPLLAPHEHPRLIDYQTARAHGEPAPSRYEFQGVRRDGSRIWLEALVTAVRWQGSPASQVPVLDITERKHWEGHTRQAQIFTTKPIGEGAGMGLAMDHGIVTNHGGAITVDSTPDDGTTITLYLPRIEDAPAQPAPPQRNFLCVV